MEQVQKQRPRKIFISHSSKDVTYVTAIVELLEDIGLTEQQVVCSSVPEYGIPLGADIYDWLSKQFQQYDLHVLFCLSKNYYKSVACLNEMGAAWVLKTKYDSILLPSFSFQDIKGAVNANQIGLKLDSPDSLLKEHLNQLKDGLIDEFSLNVLTASRWERYRDGFIKRIKEIIDVTPVEEADEVKPKGGIVLSEDASELLVCAAHDEGGRIIAINYDNGIIISTNRKGFTPAGSSAREVARWVGAVDELEGFGFIVAASYERQMFTVTREGYEAADKIEKEKHALLGKAIEMTLNQKKQNVDELL